MHRIFILYTGSCSDLYYVANIREKNKVSFNYVNLLYNIFLHQIKYFSVLSLQPSGFYLNYCASIFIIALAGFIYFLGLFAISYISASWKSVMVVMKIGVFFVHSSNRLNRALLAFVHFF